MLQQAHAYLMLIAGASTPAAPMSLPTASLEIRPRDTTTWAYCWGDRPLEGSYPDFAQAPSAALRNRPA